MSGQKKAEHPNPGVLWGSPRGVITLFCRPVPAELAPKALALPPCLCPAAAQLFPFIPHDCTKLAEDKLKLWLSSSLERSQDQGEALTGASLKKMEKEPFLCQLQLWWTFIKSSCVLAHPTPTLQPPRYDISVIPPKMLQNRLIEIPEKGKRTHLTVSEQDSWP